MNGTLPWLGPVLQSPQHPYIYKKIKILHRKMMLVELFGILIKAVLEHRSHIYNFQLLLLKPAKGNAWLPSETIHR